MEEEKKEVKEDQKEEVQAPKSLYEKTNEAVERQEAANKKTEELLKRQEELYANQKLSGTAGGRIEDQEVKAETPQEYKDRVMKGDVEYSN